MKVGRNEPCPCGSGKKYKKCCLEKDEQITSDLLNNKPVEDEWEPEEEPVIEGWDNDPDESEQQDDDDDEEADDDEDEEEEEEADDESDNEFFREEDTNLPEISDEEMKLVEDWWEKYKKMNDTVKEREHLVTFIERYPHLVDHLELYHEVLFELGGDHFQKGIYETFVELLLRIRKEYPVTYRQSFEYYDNDLICWYTVQGRLDEIDTFFNYFREDGKYNEKLEELIQFFHAINHSDILLKLLAGTKYTEHVSFIIINNIIQRYIDQPVTDELIQTLLDEFASEGIVDEQYNDKNEFKERLLRYARPFIPWNDRLPKKRSQVGDYYVKISQNFAYFLYKNTELTFCNAVIISQSIDGYYKRIIYGSNKRPSDVFCIDKKNILNSTIKRFNTVFWGCSMECFIELNALYYYVFYLQICGNISEEQKNDLLEMLTNLYQEAYKASKNQGPEMIPFGQFPLWKIKE